MSVKTGHLEIDSYNAWELAAKKIAPSAMLRSFSPGFFTEILDLTHVGEEQELIRLVETQHAFDSPLHFQAPFRVSMDEADLINSIGDQVCALTQRTFGQRVRPWNAPFSALKSFRLISEFVRLAGKSSVTVFEIGPGAGFLGALLREAGHRHISFDITQAMYLWQNRLFSELAGDKFLELADPSQPLVDSQSAQMVHFPWWRCLEISKKNFFNADIVVCEAALTEMDEHGLRFNLHLAQKMLGGSDMGLFFCHHVGSGRMLHSTLFKSIKAAGFAPIYNRLFYAFATQTRYPYCGLVIPWERFFSEAMLLRMYRRFFRWWKARQLREYYSLDFATPFYNPSGRDNFPLARDAIPLRAEERPIDYDFIKATGSFIPEPN